MTAQRPLRRPAGPLEQTADTYGDTSAKTPTAQNRRRTARWRHWSGAWDVVGALRRLPVRSLVPQTFIFARGQGRLPSYALHAEWRRVLTTAGVRHRAPEQLRHTFASTLLSRNATLLYVQKQGGWRSAAVLLRV